MEYDEPATLELIHEPTAAIATIAQRCGRLKTYSPVYMNSSNSCSCLRPAVNADGRPVNPAFQQLLDGYISAQFAEVGQDDIFYTKWRAADEAELKRATEVDPAAKFVDNTLPPRSVSAVLLIPRVAIDTGAGRIALDAFACFASGHGAEAVRPTVHFRCAVLASTHADLICKQEAHVDHRKGAALAIRWYFGDRVQTHVVDLSTGTVEEVLVQIQERLWDSRLLPNGPRIHACVSISRSVSSAVTFHTLQAEVFQRFLDLQHTKTVKRASDFKLVTPRHHVARVFPRPQHGCATMQHMRDPNAWHAVLLCDVKHRDAVDSFILRRTELPTWDENVKQLGIHVVGAVVERRPLGPDVSLFAANGVPGEPIDRYGTSMFRFDTMVLPYERLHLGFVVHPCTMQSSKAGNEMLVKYQSEFFKRAMDLAHETLSLYTPQTTADSSSAAAPPLILGRNMDSHWT